jgi:hypothetical protein
MAQRAREKTNTQRRARRKESFLENPGNLSGMPGVYPEFIEPGQLTLSHPPSTIKIVLPPSGIAKMLQIRYRNIVVVG